jgi:hypothetical protein
MNKGIESSESIQELGSGQYRFGLDDDMVYFSSASDVREENKEKTYLVK